MIPLKQQKKLRSGRVREWEIDLEAMAAAACWTEQAPELLREEMGQLIEAFPTLIAVAGVRLAERRCWVEAAEPLFGEGGGLVVFDRGARDVDTDQPLSVPEDSLVGFIVRVPSPIAGRPFERSLQQRLEALERESPQRAALWRQAILRVGDQTYIAPRFGVWFSQSHPHADPPVMVWPEYFEMLDIPADHVYFADQYYRLCLYASWREQPVVQVIQNRVVPRLLIDLLIADLQALNKLDDALTRLDLSLYELYNIVGRGDQVQPLRDIYRELVGRDASGA